MENNPQQSNTDPSTSAVKRTVLIILSLLLVGAIAAGAITVLRNIASKPSEQTNNSAITPAEEVIRAIKSPGAIKALDEFTQQNNSPDTVQVIYKAEGRGYTISTPAKESVLFVAPTPGAHRDSAIIEEQVVKFITERGYEKTENTGPAAIPMPKYTTFKSTIGTCQLASSQPLEGQQTFAFYEIACTDSTAISQEYSTLEMLLSIYKESAAIPNFTSATRSTTSEDGKSFSIVSLNSDTSKASLLFAAIDNNWELLGNLNGGAESNGKYSISAEMRSKMNDARYGDFLKKHFK